VTLNQENGRLRILLATDVGLLDYHYASAGPDPEGPWLLRGQLSRWVSVRGLRLQTDAQLDESADETRAVWRLMAEDPKIELTVTSDAGDHAVKALLDFARACIQHAA